MRDDLAVCISLNSNFKINRKKKQNETRKQTKNQAGTSDTGKRQAKKPQQQQQQQYMCVNLYCSSLHQK